MTQKDDAGQGLQETPWWLKGARPQGFWGDWERAMESLQPQPPLCWKTFIAPTSCKMSSHLGLGFKALPYGVLPSPILNLPKSVLLSPTKWVYYMVSRACQHPPQHSLLVIPTPLSLLLHTPAWSDLLFPWPVPAGLRIYYLGQFCKSFMLTFHTFISCLSN